MTDKDYLPTLITSNQSPQTLGQESGISGAEDWKKYYNAGFKAHLTTLNTTYTRPTIIQPKQKRHRHQSAGFNR